MEEKRVAKLIRDAMELNNELTAILTMLSPLTKDKPFVVKDEEKSKYKDHVAQFTIVHYKEGNSAVYKDGILTHKFKATDEYTIQHWYLDNFDVIDPVKLECLCS